MKAHTIQPNGQVIDSELTKVDFELLRDYVGGDVELVAVLFNGQPATMIVNETGAIKTPPLPINARATAIYWTATIKGITPAQFNPLSDPMIHGPAMLLEIDKRKL